MQLVDGIVSVDGQFYGNLETRRGLHFYYHQNATSPLTHASVASLDFPDALP
jgi:hypothetical protein